MDISSLKIGTKKSKLLGLALLFLSTVSNAAVTDNCADIIWSTPELREDGSAIQKIERFNLYHTYEDVLLPVIQVDAAATEYSACDLQTGIHLFYLTTIESYGDFELESKNSNTHSEFIRDSEPSKPEQPVIIVTIRISTEVIE